MRTVSLNLIVCAGLSVLAASARAEPDLTIDKRHTAPFRVGQSGTYEFVVTNVGTDFTSAVTTVTDTLPAGLTFVSGAGPGWSIGSSGPFVTATTAAPIAPGDNLSLTITVSVGVAAFPSVTNAAEVTLVGDSNAGNNRDADFTQIDGAPDLALDKRHTGMFVVGQNAAYTFVVSNVGTAATVGTITVTDTLPAGLAFVSGSGPGWSFGVNGQVVTATFAGVIAPGDSSSFTLDVTVAPDAYPYLLNAAVVTSPGDPSPANDGDTDPTVVKGGATDVGKKSWGELKARYRRR